MSNTLTILASIARVSPRMTLSKALLLASEINADLPSATEPVKYPMPRNSTSPSDAGKWVAQQPAVMNLLQGGQYIQAIKEVRSLANLGLREAKDAVDYARSNLYKG